jgi:hypothetical protein
VIVAVSGVRVMEVSSDEIVDVIAVGDGVVAAARAVRVSLRVAGARVRRSAGVGIRCVDADGALVDVALVRPVKVSIMDVVGMPGVRDRGVTAPGSVLVGMVLVGFVISHGFSFLGERW